MKKLNAPVNELGQCTRDCPLGKYNRSYSLNPIKVGSYLCSKCDNYQGNKKGKVYCGD